MPRLLVCLLAATLILPGCRRVPAESAVPPFVVVDRYDPARDAATDLASAVDEAGRTGRRVLVQVGGEWCSWCRRLDALFDQNAELAAARDRFFVPVKVNWSVENRNEAVLSRFPKIPGYPHLFVLASDGTLLHSQDTAELEQGSAHDPAKVMAFLKQWGG